MRCTWLAIGLVAAIGCGGDDGDGAPADLDVIASTPASGTIMGTPFTLGTRFMNVSSGELFVDLLPTPAADCTNDETDGDYPFIIFSAPPASGRLVVGVDEYVTLVPAPNTNLVVGRGVIQIDSVTATTVSGGLHVWDAEYGEIDGRFDGALCFTN